MSNPTLEPLATEAGQDRIVQAINNFGSLENAYRAEVAANTAVQKAAEARQWASEDGIVVEGDETLNTPDLYSAKHYAEQASQSADDAASSASSLVIDATPTENSTNAVQSGSVYTALAGKQDALTFDNTPTANSDNPVKSGGVYSALDTKADKSTTYTKTEVDTALSGKANQSTTYTKTEVDTALSNVQGQLTFDSTPTANSTNPVTSGGIYNALQNVNIDIDDEITEDSDNPVTSAAIYEALQNFTPSGGDSGGAGNASGVVVETIYTGNNSMLAVNDELNLSKSWKDYDVLEFVFFAKSNTLADSNPYGATRFVTTKSIQNSYSTNQNFRIGLFVNDLGSDTRMLTLRVPSETKFVVNTNGSNNQSLNIQYINGIKFSKNLTEQMYSNVLWENSSGVTSGTITLSDDWNNYDFVGFDLMGSSTSALNSAIWDTQRLYEVQSTGKQLVVLRVHDSRVYMTISQSNYNQMTISSTAGDGRLERVVGYKLAQGGYSGIVTDARMTVKSGIYEYTTETGTGTKNIPITFDSPMPDTNYTVITSHASSCSNFIKVFSDIREQDKTTSGFTLRLYCDASAGSASNPYKISWVAIRPNSYTREGMVEDVLFSNASGVSSGTINLSGNISDYDLIQFTFSKVGEIYSSNDPNIITKVVSTDEIIDIMTTKQSKYIVEGLSNCFIVFNSFLDNSISISYNHQSSLSILKITGIKFGRYVGNVEIDSTVTQNGTGLVTGSAVYTAIQTALNSITNANGVSY